MPNTRYKDGLRVVVSNDGKQRIADPQGTPLPCIVSTVVRQDYEQAMFGVALCEVVMYVNTGDGMAASGSLEVNSEGQIKLPNGVWYSPISITVEHETVDRATLACFTVNASLDPTT